MFENLKREIEKDFDKDNNFVKVIEKTHRKENLHFSYWITPILTVAIVSVIIINLFNLSNKDDVVNLNINNAISNKENSNEKKWIIKKVDYDPKTKFSFLGASKTKNWDVMTITEKFTQVEYNNRHYGTGNVNIEIQRINQYLGSSIMLAYNTNEDKKVETEVKLYSINNVAEKASIAVKFEDDDNYYAYANMNYMPETLHDFISDFNFRENASFDYVNYFEWYGDNEDDYNYIEFLNIDDKVIWDMLLNYLDKPDIPSEYAFHRRIMGIKLNLSSIGLNDEPLGIFINIMEDGYISSNILEHNKCFYIGEEITQAFMNYIIDNYDGYLYVYENDNNNSEYVHDDSKIIKLENTTNAVTQEYQIKNNVVNPTNTTLPKYN